MIRYSIIFSGVVRMGVTGPNVFSISLRFWARVYIGFRNYAYLWLLEKQ